MSFRLRITLCMVTAIAVLFGIGGAVLIHASFRASVENEENAAVDNTSLILKMLEMFESASGYLEEEDLTGTLRQITDRNDFHAIRLVRENDGSVLYTRGDGSIFRSGGDAKKGTIIVTYASPEKKEKEDTMYLITTSELELGGDPYVLHIARNLMPVYEVRERQLDIFRRIYLIMLAAAILLSFLAATWLTRSLRMLSRATREIASGNLSYRSRIRSDDEVGMLSRDFDHMAGVMEENVASLKEEAEKRERFMGAFTHELKTPMTSIIGYADLIRSQSLSEEEKEDALGYIFSEGKRLENMSLKLLDLFVADNADLTLSPTDVQELVLDVTGHLESVFEHSGIRILAETEPGSANLEPDMIRTLLINLLDNAKKAMPKGGSVRVFQNMTPDGVRLIVADEGRGMKEEEIAHITEAFYRVDKSRSRKEGSAGLGLALCDKIVALHKGSMRFESTPGKGTTVYVELKGGRA